MPDLSQEPTRPSPEALLDEAQRERRAEGGRLKIFIGAAPGVGKTYTMLQNARAKMAAGVDVVAGIVETHGRHETAQLLQGLPAIPLRGIHYRGHTLQEMDIDGILQRRPRLVLVDELAHTNVAGSRHPKRYLDVEELLDEGIDVYTTVNIQHLESLNDAVAQITGIRVQETVPDRILAHADEIELVDISVEDLLQRLREGKVYLPEQAERAIRHYFRPGNLNALRQLALRQTAERVDDQMEAYMRTHAIPGPWPATERMAVSIGPSPLSGRLVRATKRMAQRRGAEWSAVYVETPRHYRLSDTDRNRLARTMRLAEELGGQAITVPGGNVAEDLIHYAQTNNITEIVIGKSHRPWWFRLLHGSIVDELIRKSGAIDIYVITGNEEESAGETSASGLKPTAQKHWHGYLLSIAIVAAAALLSDLLQTFLSLPNLSMVFLLGVLVCAVLWGLRVSVMASLLSVLLYDFFFVPPIHTFTISRPEDVLALIVFLVVAVLTSNLTGRIRDQAEAARRREARTAALYNLSSALAGAVGLEQVTRVIAHQISRNLEAEVVVLLPESDCLRPMASHPAAALTDSEIASATWGWRHNQAVGRSSGTLPGERRLYLPLRSAHGAIGVLVLLFPPEAAVIDPEQQRLLDALGGQSALAVERATLARNIEQAQLLSERERLQAILLSAISHDLRTPLASILGSATSLLESNGGFSQATQRELLKTIQEEGERLNRFVGNLLDATRLESGALTLHREWGELAEIIGTALSRLQGIIAKHQLVTEVEPDLPLLRLDVVLIEQVLVNLIENAVKYSLPASTITLRAFRAGDMVVIEVEDEGVGISAQDIEKVFDKFYRVEHGDRVIAGTGLGLSICRGIVEEHGGRIIAASPGKLGRGAIFRVTFPVEELPPQGLEL
ncbi:MAG: sensor histidine kinase KdpD [Chlorobi bacterium CHB2]|nr:sensor histidine kinase KdpD [Chlorobi bacterium CHB2]